MRIKSLLKKASLLMVMMILLITLLGTSATGVFAADPQPVPGTMKVGYPGTQNTYFDIYINNGPKLPGWCIETNVYITPGTEYNANVYDYFGQFYPDYVHLLPDKVKNAPWFAIAHIINNKIGTGADVQNAIHHFTNGINVTGNALAMVNAAKAYLLANDIFIPGPGQLKPMVVYVSNTVQIIFFEYEVPEPPAPPIPELPAGALLGLGLVGLAGFGWFGYRKSQAVAV